MTSRRHRFTTAACRNLFQFFVIDVWRQEDKNTLSASLLTMLRWQKAASKPAPPNDGRARYNADADGDHGGAMEMVAILLFAGVAADIFAIRASTRRLSRWY